jgi:molecular chaperone Hsp33
MTLADLILPFQLDRPNLRGRLVRLGPAASAILQRHDYPYDVARLLAETMTLSALLAGMLKYDGIFTLQTKTEGPVRLLVADFTSGGAMRAYAQFDEKAVQALGKNPTAKDLLGDGYLAFTVDQNGGTGERYQGIVELNGDSLSDFVQHYFRLSEQIDTAIKLGTVYSPAVGWQMGGIMLQRLPEEKTDDPASHEEDDWRRAMVLLSTATDDELSNPDLPAQDLLYRLFHEEEPRAYTATPVFDQCRCSRDRARATLGALGRAELRLMAKNNEPAHITCEFCSRTYTFPPDELQELGTSEE